MGGLSRQELVAKFPQVPIQDSCLLGVWRPEDGTGKWTACAIQYRMAIGQQG